LARQPLLAGIKHANRLEQVMAAQALRDQGYDDGIMCLDNGHVICTTRANVFALMGHVWYTPALNEAGVAGTRRAWFLERGTQGWWDVQESELTLEQLYQADAVMISNALRGFQEVGSINGHQLSSSIQIQRVRQRYMDTLAAEL
jgi:4-amino-4-deoxychorismate lyase